MLMIDKKYFDDRINELSNFLKNKGYKPKWEIEKRTLEILKRKAITFSDDEIEDIITTTSGTFNFNSLTVHRRHKLEKIIEKLKRRGP